MLDEGLVHILATDAHDVERRPPNLGQGREFAAKRIGDTEAVHLVVTRPQGVLNNEPPANLPGPQSATCSPENVYNTNSDSATRGFAGLAERLRTALGLGILTHAAHEAPSP